MSNSFDSFMKDKNKKNKGYIYVITDNQGNYKVGSTKNINNRINQMQTNNAFELTLYAQWLLYDYEEAEKILHEFLEDKKVRGEWFNLGDDDIHRMCICLYDNYIYGVNFDWEDYFNFVGDKSYEQ